MQWRFSNNFGSHVGKRDTLLCLTVGILPTGEIANMKTSALLLFGFLLCAASAFSQTESEIRDRIVGTWKLVSAEDIMKAGTTRPYPTYGPHGKGFLMYQRDGYMCADLVNPDRPKWADPVHTTPEEKVAAADGTFAYCGRYEIDAKQKQIIHLPEVATDPNTWDRAWLDGDEIRHAHNSCEATNDFLRVLLLVLPFDLASECDPTFRDCGFDFISRKFLHPIPSHGRLRQRCPHQCALTKRGA